MKKSGAKRPQGEAVTLSEAKIVVGLVRAQQMGDEADGVVQGVMEMPQAERGRSASAPHQRLHERGGRGVLEMERTHATRRGESEGGIGSRRSETRVKISSLPLSLSLGKSERSESALLLKA